MTMNKTDFYINGAWVAPAKAQEMGVINPALDQVFATISLGSAADVDTAVDAAQAAFPTWSQTSKQTRIELLQRLVSVYERRNDEMATIISQEMGAPIDMSTHSQATSGSYHLNAFIETLENFEFESKREANGQTDYILHEAIGVCGLITPWNWPMNQVALKVGAAVGAGCTVVLKPSEIAPLSSMLFAEFMDEAGFPAGVFNLVNGEGPVVGEAMSAHTKIDMMSFTGSTRAGVAVSKGSADTIKRVSLELGGKSPNLIFADADVEKAVKRGVRSCFNNTGQSCNAPSRMLVEQSIYDQAVKIAQEVAEQTRVGMPDQSGRHIGPLVSQTQYDKVQGLIQAAIDEGAELIAGGTGKPEGLEQGYFVKPTVFAGVNNDMTIAREEVFGPVLSILPFETEEQAIEIANDTPYGLSAYVQTGDSERAKRVSRALRAGMIEINGQGRLPGSPFGGYKQSGSGREGGQWGIEEFLEIKVVSV